MTSKQKVNQLSLNAWSTRGVHNLLIIRILMAELSGAALTQLISLGMEIVYDICIENTSPLFMQ